MPRKMLCLLIALLLLFTVPTLAEESADADPLGWEELRTWANDCLEKARSAELLNDPHDDDAFSEDGYAFVYSFATLYLDRPELTENSELQAVVLSIPGTEGPRGIAVGSSIQDVFAAYYNENERLSGTEDAAVLYLRDDMPAGISWGFVQRRGEQPLVIEYATCEALETGGEGYANAGVTYLLEDFVVSAIRVYGLQDRLTADELLDRCAEVEAVQARGDYAPGFTAEADTAQTPFGAEDLSFSGIDFPSMTREQAEAVLGTALSENWMQDDDGAYICSLVFEGCELTYLYSNEKNNPRLDMVTIYADTVAGPRGIRVGDTLSRVINGFPYGAYEMDENTSTQLLYGALDSASWGLAEYGGDTTLLRYAFTLEDGRTAHLLYTFDGSVLAEQVMYLN